MSRLDAFEDQLSRALDGAAGALFKSTLNPVQIMKRATKEMSREKLVFEGKQYAPTLYSVLVNGDDDRKLAGFYPTMAGEMETALKAQAQNLGLDMDGDPLVRFIVEPGLKRGKFDVIAENVAASIVEQLRVEEMTRYGLADQAAPSNAAAFMVGESRRQQKRPRTNPLDGSYVNVGSRVERAQRIVRQQPSATFNAERVVRDRFADAGVAGEEWIDDSLPGFDEPQGSFNYEDAAANLIGSGDQEAADDGGQMPQACIVSMDSGKSYPIDDLQVSIGRERSNKISIRDANISRVHAEILYEDGAFFLRDLGSTNGTFINDDPIDDSEIFDGDVITFGVANFEFRVGRH